MTIVITAFERSPDGGKGLARDMRVRWALEEVGEPYEVRLVSSRAKKEPAHADPRTRDRQVRGGRQALGRRAPASGQRPHSRSTGPTFCSLGRCRLARWAFSAGDLMMVSVLLRLRPSGLLDEFPKLAAYVARGEGRPAYKRAFAAQLAINQRP